MEVALVALGGEPLSISTGRADASDCEPRFDPCFEDRLELEQLERHVEKAWSSWKET